MNYNFLPEKIRKELSAKFADKVPSAVIRSSGNADGGSGEGYLVFYDDSLVVFSRKLGEDSFYFREGKFGCGVSARLRKDGMDNYIDIALGDSTVSMKISGIEVPDAQKICSRLENGMNQDGGSSTSASAGNAAVEESQNAAQEFSDTGSVPALAPLEALALAVMFVAACDQEISDSENRYILALFRDSLDILKKAHATYKKTDYDSFLSRVARSRLSKEQKLCILANMMEIGMVDGSYHGTEQMLVNRFASAAGISKEDSDAILSVLIIKNNLSIM